MDKASASASVGRRFEPHGERLSKDGCLSWDLFRYGWLVSRKQSLRLIEMLLSLFSGTENQYLVSLEEIETTLPQWGWNL
ncbi:hypothetical protein DPMN_059451 [Dreissena polymorpha]|uniref:Uncharacterized protein n=1 Tax=Dreissena polymorpha TaxID=45954 RepID=A0A9D4C3I5_DREPO|nr:hypothetical protein DPMN_059451 [Dreissena polymorpha]